MGTLFYGAGRTSILIEDVRLAHLKILTTAKLRRGEGFLLSWVDDANAGHGRSSVWIHPGCDLHYKFDGDTPPQIDPALLDELSTQAISARGIELTEATLSHSPREGASRLT